MNGPAPHPLLIRLAHALLRKADRSQGQRAVTLKLDDKLLPELHDPSSTPDQHKLFELLLTSLARTGWVALRTKKPQAFQTLADLEPALTLLNASALAAWSGFHPDSPKWIRELVRHLSAPGLLDVPDPNALLDYLQRSPLPWFQQRTATDCAATLNQLAAICRSGMCAYVREVSARCFRGHSKVLDNREELLRLLGARPGQFLEAPVQLLVDLPGQSPHPDDGPALCTVLWVENLVSFERLARDRQPAWANAALVYASGFKSTARRLRTPQGCTLYWRHTGNSSNTTAFSDWLYAPDANHTGSPSVQFYGDLDFAGMQILAQLRHSFPDCQAWQPGYGALLSLLTTSGHAPASAGKEGQTDPGSTGCKFADDVLLPALRSSAQCVDQEAWP